MKFAPKVSVTIGNKPKSSSGFIFITIALQLLIFSLFFIVSKTFSYSIDNYRYIFSSLLQIIGGIFAFIASSTLVAYQFLTSFSPMSTKYYPKNLFISFLVITLIIIGIDVSAIYILQTEFNTISRCTYDFLVSLNIYPLSLSLKYILYVINSISPQNQLKRLIQKAKIVQSNEERLDIIYSLEEICLSAIRNGQGGYIRSCQERLQEIVDIYSTTYVELNEKSHEYPDNPLRIIPNIVERISYSMFDHNMQNLVHYNGHILRELSGAKYDDRRIVNVEIASAIKNISIYGIEQRKTTDVYNFVANAIYCIDESNSASTLFWGCKLLIIACEDCIDINPRDTLRIIEEIFECVDFAIKNKTLRPKNGVLMIDFLLTQSWLKPYYEKYDSKKIISVIDKLRDVRDDLYELSKNNN